MMGHYVADFGLQTENMVKFKNPLAKPKDKHPYVPWYYWMTAHGGIHAFFVYLFTQNIYLAIAEWCFHWVIDTGKMMKFYKIHTDQALHLLCKLLWAFMVSTGF
jgi:hypothetical protein